MEENGRKNHHSIVETALRYIPIYDNTQLNLQSRRITPALAVLFFV